MSLDVFRGITIAGMILVNNPGSWGSIYPALEHAEWNGCTPTDLVFPFFLFIVGVAITFSLSKRKERGDNQNKLLFQILRRGLMLFALGLIMAGFPNYNLSTIRIPGVLQRIAVVYVISSFIFLKSGIKTTVILSAILLILYWVIMTLIPVPGIGAGNLEKGTNIAAWLDQLILGNHVWSYSKPWDPEGILSTMPAIVISGNLLIVLGYVWDMWFPLNKNLWSSSYVVYTAGLALNFLAICYWFIDILGYKKWAKPFQVYGLNAITVYFLSGIAARLLNMITITAADGKDVALKSFLYNTFFLSWLQPINASLVFALTYVLIWLGLMWILYARNIFIKV
jgi:predicted acyltransferase